MKKSTVDTGKLEALFVKEYNKGFEQGTKRAVKPVGMMVKGVAAVRGGYEVAVVGVKVAIK